MDGATLLVCPPAQLNQLSPDDRADLLAYADPDALLVPTRHRSPLFTHADHPVLTPDGSAHALGDVTVVVARDAGDLTALESWAHDGALGAHTYVVSDLLDLDIDTDHLSTALTGDRRYRMAVGSPDAPITHLSSNLPADYDADWDGFRLRGCGPIETQGAPALPVLSLGVDGVVAVDEVRLDRLGLRAIPGVGERRAETLQRAGYRRRDLVSAALRDLAELPGFGRETAQAVVRGARAIEDGELTRLTDAPLPPRPVFIDIETDGLSPSVVWQVGVLSGEDTYTSFLARTPDEGPAMLDAVLDHLPTDGTLVAWNGWGFDYPVLERFVVDWLPEREAEWRSLHKADLLRWARDDGNAVLPGRTNRLEDVAGALGFTGEETGLTGAETARRYRRWVRGGPEPDWERHQRYCENDVRMLAHVYEAIADAGRLAPSSQPTGHRTRQGSLSEF